MISFVVTHDEGKGSAKLYQAGCRCDECRSASTRAQAARRERRRQERIAEVAAMGHAELIEILLASRSIEVREAGKRLAAMTTAHTPQRTRNWRGRLVAS